MRILIVSRPVAPPWDSGTKNMALGIANRLERFQAHLLTTRQIPDIDGSRAFFEPIYSDKEFTIIQKVHLFLRLMRGHPKVDLYHFFLRPSLLTASLCRGILKKQGKPSILTTYVSSEERANFRDRFFGDVNVVYSDYAKRLLQTHDVNNSVRIYPGVDVCKFHPRVNAASLRHKAGLEANSFVVLYAGDCGLSADFESLIQAIAVCRAKLSNIKFILACRLTGRRERKAISTIRQRCEKLNLTGSLIILGTVPYMRELISLSDVCILPLRSTTGRLDIPMFLLEALAEEKPIVITDIAPLNEILQDDVGFAIPQADGLSLAEAIIELAHNPDQRHELGRKGRALVVERFNIAEIAKQYEELYWEILKDG